jgi:hypothetical protein
MVWNLHRFIAMSFAMRLRQNNAGVQYFHKIIDGKHYAIADDQIHPDKIHSNFSGGRSPSFNFTLVTNISDQFDPI